VTAPASPNPRNLVALAVATALAFCGSREEVEAAQLPVPCGGAACGPNGPANWVSAGGASLVRGGNTLTVNQSTPSAMLNWQSFNVSADGKVNFVQPSSSSVAVNRIFQGSASQIFGSLNANGIVYLLNQNGIVFGTGSAVNVGGLLASSLNLSPAALARGIAGAANNPSGSDTTPPGPALQPFDGEVVNTGSVTVQSGASITAQQGQILLFAPTVSNSGTLSTPNGQTILGAGQKIYLTASQDSNIRGLLIEVSGCGDLPAQQCSTPTVTNKPLGEIIASTGNVTLAGLAVEQEGRVSATTSVRSNGSILLKARAADVGDLSTNGLPNPNKTGTLTLGASSLTSVTLEGGPNDKTVDVNAQPKSSIDLIGGQIDVLDHASVVATSGNVALSAVTDPNPAQPPTSRFSQPDGSRVYLAPTSSIDVSGASVSESVSDNSLAVELRGSQTEDFPQQRSGPLRGQTVYVDIRQHGTYSDGTTWVGTPIADLSGDVSAVQRDVFQRNLTGGTINLNAGGSVIVSPGATLDISGGQINWQAGYVKTSVLVAPNGKLTPIGQANPYISYLGTLDTISQGDPHWGTVANVTLPGYNAKGVYQPSYVEGKDAGTLSIIAPAFILDGSVAARTVIGPLQRTPTDLGFRQTPLANRYFPGMAYRFADQVPLGGTLTLGNADMLNLGLQEPARGVLQDLTFAAGSILATIKGPNGGPFDPLKDPLPESFVSSLRPDLIAPGALANLNAYADGTITLPAGTGLAPGPGANITLAAGAVDFAGSVVSSGGSVTLETIPTTRLGGSLAGAPADSAPNSLLLERTASIDLRGAWINDPLSPDQTQLSPLYIGGGTAALRALLGGSLTIESGARIDVSGGAQRTVARSIVAGAGGSISIAAVPTQDADNASQLNLPADLSNILAGYGLADGGKLSLTAPDLCVSSLACADSAAYRVDPAVLTGLGFGAVTLSAQPSLAGGLVIGPDVNVSLRQENLQFLPGALNKASAANLADLTQLVTLPDYMRHPENLTLASSALKRDDFSYADLRISAGATLGFDP
jgi:filamentous hemagglutinin family protein